MIDVIEVDFKAPLEKRVFERVTKSKTFFKDTRSLINNFKNTLQLLKGLEEVKVIFKTLIVPGLLYKQEDVLKIAKTIKEYDALWVLQSYKKLKVKSSFSVKKTPSKKFLNYLKRVCFKKYPNLKIIIKK